MMYDHEAVSKEFAFGRCRRCERPPNGYLFGDHILWAMCTRCNTAWWAMFSYEGWDTPEVKARQRVAEFAGWDIGDEEEALEKSEWDLKGERQDAYVNGTAGEKAFSLIYGLPWRKDFSRQDFRGPDGTPIHVRSSPFEKAALALRPNDNTDSDLNVLMQIDAHRRAARAVCWWGGPPCRDCGRRHPHLKSMENFPLKEAMRKPADVLEAEQE